MEACATIDFRAQRSRYWDDVRQLDAAWKREQEQESRCRYCGAMFRDDPIVYCQGDDNFIEALSVNTERSVFCTLACCRAWLKDAEEQDDLDVSTIFPEGILVANLRTQKEHYLSPDGLGTLCRPDQPLTGSMRIVYTHRFDRTPCARCEAVKKRIEKSP